MSDLFIPGRPLLVNRERKLHRLQAAAEIREIRRSAALLAKAHRLAPMTAVTVTAQPHVHDRIGQDLGACMPTVKAAVDGLVDARVLADDTPTYVRGLTFLPVVCASELGDGLLLTLEEVVHP